MKKILSFTLMFLVAIVMFAGDKVKTVFTLDHQMSEMCEKKIKENLRYEKGVSNIDVSLKDNTITVTYDKDKTNPTALLTGFKKIGFNAEVVNQGACCGKKAEGGCCKDKKAEGGCCGKKAEGGCCKDKKAEGGSCGKKAEGGCCKNKKK